jgi:hypothetical protein
LARVPTGFSASGAKASRSVVNCFSEDSRKRTVALAFIFKPTCFEMSDLTFKMRYFTK